MAAAILRGFALLGVSNGKTTQTYLSQVSPRRPLPYGSAKELFRTPHEQKLSSAASICAVPNTPLAALPLHGAATTDLQLTCTRVPVVLSEASDPSTPSPTSSMPPYLHAVASRATGGHCISLVTAVQFSIFHFHSKRNCFTTKFHSLLEQSRVLSPCQTLYFPSIEHKNKTTVSERAASFLPGYSSSTGNRRR